jgi:NAD(P)-dependent dehydrogenase (short-subunit alcohol dehydrogenase family)
LSSATQSRRGPYPCDDWTSAVNRRLSTARDTGPDLQTFRLAEGEKMTPQVVLITGALTGIGRATAVAFANKGAKVVVSGRHDDKGQALVAELKELGAEAEFVRADVTKEEEVRNLVDETVARFGRLDVAVNNAGFEGEIGPIQDATAENFKAVHDTNVLGVFLSMKYELRAMAGQGSGSIVNISSTYGHKAAAGGTAYVSSKYAVEGLTKTVALEQGNSGIRVNAVGPGLTDTHMADRFTGSEEGNDALLSTVPFRRRGNPEEIANAIVFISSAEASYISGTVLDVDGGMSAT